MRIKRLKVTGFKSFVEPSELRIEPGLTGIVGPNGCGKSNVLEAIRWVMGEGSPKSLRGSGMDDVIFAGTATRPPRDFAEVTMLVERAASGFSDDAGLAPSGETEITRRIERGAGSAYRVNGRDVRAKDVALLFADAATGAHSPALVSQGKIGAIIAAKPTERRAMLEEAAGISGLHVRRRDAESKLRATETNLARLDEVLIDMEARAGALRRQARSAEKYRRLSEEIRAAEARLVYARWREAAAAAEAAKQEAAAADAKVAEAAAQHKAAADAQSEAALAVAERRREAGAAREAASELTHRLATLRAERDGAARRVAELAQRRRSLAADRMREEALAQDAEAALVRLTDEIAGIAARLSDAEARRGTIDIRTVEGEDRAREAETALGKARAIEAAQQAEARVARAALETARQKRDRAGIEADRIAGQVAGLDSREPLEQALGQAQIRRAAGEQALEAAGAAIAEAEAQRIAAAEMRDRSESAVATARAALAALESEARALAKALEGGPRDRMLDLVSAAPGYERALAAALGDDLEAGVDTGSRRWTGAAAQAGDPPLAAGLESLADHIDAPDALTRRLRQIGIAVEDDDTIVLAVGQRLVTRAGRLRRWDGFVAEGAGAAAAERLIRRNRLTEIEAALPAARTQLEQALAAAVEAARALAEAGQKLDAGRRAEVEATATIRDAQRAEDAAAAELERLAIRRAGLEERQQAAQVDLADAEQGLVAAQAVVADLPDAGATAAEIALLAEAARAAQSALAEVRAEAATHARAVAADRQRSEAAVKERGDWQRRVADAAMRRADVIRRLEDAEAEALELADAPSALESKLARITDSAAQAALTAQTSAEAERSSEETLRQADTRLAAAAETLSQAREARAGAAARAENQDARRVEMGRISGEKFQCPPPLLPERAGFEAGDVGDAAGESARLDRLTLERERLGPVNLVAEQELQELEDGRATSLAEREELGLAINRLRGSIGSLNREGRVRLLAAFEAVNGHFRSLFTTLFDGGQAHLELVESDDPLEAGLEIMAQPPGKRLSALTLLSGGEQALTACALIFALFLTNPAPICVLDEVDAPLDDANVERFCDLLDRMVAKTDTRYLIVTHNAVTMARMHRLFGVTMVEKGVSRLVSVDLGGAERLLKAAE